MRKNFTRRPDGIAYDACTCAGDLDSQFFLKLINISWKEIPFLSFAESSTKLISKTSDIDDNGMIIRILDVVRPLTLCNCDCKLLHTAICRGLHWYTMICIHPSQRCISSRQMTDNIFDIWTAVLTHGVCTPHE